MKNEKPDFAKPNASLRAAFDAKDGKTAETILLRHIKPLIEAAGGVPSNQFRRALRAARALDRIASLPVPPPHPDEKTYRVTATNGREFTVHVYPKEDVFAACKREQIEIASFVKL